MQSLCTIPTDVLSLVLSYLNACDLVRLMLTCHAMYTSISNDKQLWAWCARRELTGYQRRLIPHRILKAFQDASGLDVQSWVRHALSLDKNYASCAFAAHRICSEATYAVTWMRLIRGRWCLVASSNLNESRLTLWDLSSVSDGLHPCARIFLPGPIMDGQVDDASNTIRVAVTIGSSDTYVQILSVGQVDGRPKINALRDIPGFAHTLLLRGSLVGVASMNGDDAFPLLIEWTTGKIATLRPVSIAEGPDYHFLNKHLPCYAITSWKEYVVLVLAEEIQVYERPNFASFQQSRCATLISVHPLDFIQRHYVTSWVAEAHFADFGTWDQSIFGLNQTFHSPPLHIFIRDNSGRIHLYGLTCSTDGIPTLTLSGLPCDQPKESVRCKFVDQIIVGSNGSKILLRHSAVSPVCQMSIADIQTTILPREYLVGDSESSVIQNHRYIPVDRLAQLQFWSCTDFDDARGIFVTGNSRGDLCVGRFVEGHILSAISIVDSLPAVEGLPMEQNCVEMKLPVYYEYASVVAQGQLPSPLFQAVTQSWGLVDGQPFTVPGWSSDWHRFQNIRRWIVPHLRWGGADIHFSYCGNDSYFNGDEAITTILRHTYNIVGEVHPILYCKDYHDSVIFRVGQRYYLYYWQRDDDEDNNKHALNVYAFTQTPQRSIESLKTEDFRIFRELQPYYSEPNIVSSGQELQINIYDEILHDAVFLGEEDGDMKWTVINGRIIMQGVRRVRLPGRTWTVNY
ncbi:hypothetical protein BD410DRAFT_781865 [Rickenella mellea]|uniref:F-box domain-containing protein n=1 Tax=Rickenella mellea TaxID=50990 RepID=A0A4Y7QKJ1_9AGAM|nr:hypothetical protein BD410DRAFT_781865 [Rickenella mellea]